MSGPKDYTFTFEMERLIRIRQELNERGRRRADFVAEHLATARAETDIILANMRQTMISRQRTVGAALREQATRQRENIAKTPVAKKPNSAAVDKGSQSVPAVDLPMHETLNQDAPGATKSIVEAENKYQELVGWQKALAVDEDARTFLTKAVAEWSAESRELVSKVATNGLAGCTNQLNDLVLTAQQLHQRAGDVAGKFHTRNLLLQDVMDSMKSIGFFVSDPFFEVPGDPAAPVIVKASMGAETMSASIDLSDTIRSVWNGVENEACKDMFFKYVDEMKSRGVAIQATRPDLGNRPILKQRGANELPRSSSQTKGT